MRLSLSADHGKAALLGLCLRQSSPSFAAHAILIPLHHNYEAQFDRSRLDISFLFFLEIKHYERDCFRIARDPGTTTKVAGRVHLFP